MTVFRIMHSYCLSEIPYGMIALHGAQAYRNHSQSIDRLNERGGLSPCEAVAVLEDREWKKMPTGDADLRLILLVEEYERNR